MPKVQAGPATPDAKPTPELKVAQRTFFALLYHLLVGRDTGPRLPTLLLAVGPDRVRTLLGSRQDAHEGARAPVAGAWAPSRVRSAGRIRFAGAFRFRLRAFRSVYDVLAKASDVAVGAEAGGEAERAAAGSAVVSESVNTRPGGSRRRERRQLHPSAP